MSYQSPIEINTAEPFIEAIRTKTDEYVYRSILNVGVNVDKDELLKALAYDRDQYEKGYADGKRDAVPVVHAKWIERGKMMIVNLENAREQYAALGYPHRNECRLECSNCRMLTLVDESILYEYCPHCGARMDKEENV